MRREGIRVLAPESARSTLTSGRAVVASDLTVIGERLDAEFRMMSGKSLLVTGGAGFLGYYLVQSVLHWNDRGGQAPIHVTVLDNLHRGLPPWLVALADRQDLTVVRHSIAEPLPFAAQTFAYIMHAASIGSPTHYRDYPLETMDANVLGLRRLLDLSRPGGGVERLLVFSSSEIYGDPPPHEIPTTESYRGNVSCTGPRACYDESKRFCEALAVVCARRYGTPATIVRPFNNYGPGLRLDDRRLVPDLARNVLAGEDLVLWSDGAATRTFCYVADAVVGYFKALARGRPGEPYNIGVEAPEITVAELAARIQAIARDEFGYHGTIVHRTSDDRDYTTDNPARRCPSIAKAARELGYTPMIGLEEGLRRSLLWYRDQLGSAA